MRLIRLKDQRGDTIVEVLIASAIISLILVVSYAITTKNTQAIQNNQERMQAQHIAESQLEALRAQGYLNASGDCFIGATETSAGCNTISQPGSGASYRVKVTGFSGPNPPVGSVFTVNISWDALGGSTSATSMVYRLR